MQLGFLLRLARQVRGHSAALYKTMLLPMASPYAVAGMGAAEEYSRRNRGKPGHGEGRPERHVFAAIAATLMNRAVEANDSLVICHVQALFDLYPIPLDLSLIHI